MSFLPPTLFYLFATLITLILGYRGVRFYIWVIWGIIFFSYFSHSYLFWVLYSSIVAIFLIPSVRSALISKRILTIVKKLNLIPKISETERIALEAGDKWVESEMFSGKPDFKRILNLSCPKLSEKEENFINIKTDQLCSICDDYETRRNSDLSDKVWKFLKKEKFFGMIIPEEYGGLGFSAYAHSQVIAKLSSRSITLAITTMVPNSLGPAELLLEYGTDEQKQYFLPRLACGDEIPCFALTEETAGSDAGSLKAEGELYQDNGELKIKLNFSKRYITLGAVSTIIGLAFRLKDPQKLLNKGEDLGLTCALIKSDAKGIVLGRRHDPLGVPFVNSPVDGVNVVIPADDIIGGVEMAGMGWKMLMESLAAGRGISLPSTAVGGAKLVSRVTSAYCLIRKQFGISIGKFRGIEEVLARIFSKTYMIDAMRKYSCSAIDDGFRPSVATAIAKYYATENFRDIINDGMDILGGAGIIMGRRNLLANAYISAPISITVEGANIMTRSLIHFGQGAIRCHPYLTKEIDAIKNNDIAAFDKAIFSHLGHIIRNKFRYIILFITRGHFHFSGESGIVKKYEKKLAWVSANFAYLADAGLIYYGGSMKMKERLSGKLGDILSNMYIAIAVLNKFKESNKDRREAVVVRYIMSDILSEIQDRIEDIYLNFGGFFGFFFKWFLLPLTRINLLSFKSSHKEMGQLSSMILKDEQAREKLTSDIYIPEDEKEPLARYEKAYSLIKNNEEAIEKIKDAIKHNDLPKAVPEDIADQAFDEGIINEDELNDIKLMKKICREAIKVDEYSLKEYKDL